MTETERLRALLDERGVEWKDHEGPFPITAWESNGVIWVAKAYRTGVFSVETRPVTPEQAIAATLGNGTCKRTTTRNGKFKTKYGRKVPLCECCGYAIGDDRYNFCPKCGAKIVEVVER